MRSENAWEQSHAESRYDGRHPSAVDEGLVEQLLLGIVALVGQLLRGLWVVASRFPLPTVAAALLALAWWRGIAVPVGIGLAVLGLALLVFRLACRDWWRARISAPRQRRRVRAWLRKSWPVLCDRVGLTVTDRDRRTGAVTESTPGLSGLSWSASGTVLRGIVHLVPGQLVDDLGEAAERLGEAARAHQCRIVRTGPGTAELALLFGDPLADLVPPVPIPDPVNLAALPIGLREDGSRWLLRLTGTHVLLAGVTGAGKGSVVWSLLRALAPKIHDGTVRVWAVDGKAGMELAPGRALFSRFAADIEAGVELLEDAVQLMTDRAARMAGVARVHTPSVEEPVLLVLVDEVALLTGYQPDRKLRDRAERALATLASQGRAPGVVLVAALQDPRKEVLGLRNLFPTKIGMRLDEKTQVDMVLGDGARDAGALCHKIPDSLPGVGFVKLDGLREPVRVRAAYLTDADITALAKMYPAARAAPVLSAVPDLPVAVDGS
ncbi:MAG: cell division protein FtsK [Mycobacterium sp.]|nr:cell division protein FtsK [Mycobacterium sp.]